MIDLICITYVTFCYWVYAPPTNLKPAHLRVQAKKGWKANSDSEFACF
jgi:hypothetical protein